MVPKGGFVFGPDPVHSFVARLAEIRQRRDGLWHRRWDEEGTLQMVVQM